MWLPQQAEEWCDHKLSDHQSSHSDFAVNLFGKLKFERRAEVLK